MGGLSGRVSFAVSLDGGCRAGCRLRRRRMDEGLQIQGENGGAVGSEVSSDVCMGQGLQIHKGPPGRVSSGVSFGVCMGEGSQIEGGLWGRAVV